MWRSGDGVRNEQMRELKKRERRRKKKNEVEYIGRVVCSITWYFKVSGASSGGLVAIFQRERERERGNGSFRERESVGVCEEMFRGERNGVRRE